VLFWGSFGNGVIGDEDRETVGKARFHDRNVAEDLFSGLLLHDGLTSIPVAGNFHRPAHRVEEIPGDGQATAGSQRLLG
jgi:hypothetical protein